MHEDVPAWLICARLNTSVTAVVTLDIYEQTVQHAFFQIHTEYSSGDGTKYLLFYANKWIDRGRTGAQYNMFYIFAKGHTICSQLLLNLVVTYDCYLLFNTTIPVELATYPSSRLSQMVYNIPILHTILSHKL